MKTGADSLFCSKSDLTKKQYESLTEKVRQRSQDMPWKLSFSKRHELWYGTIPNVTTDNYFASKYNTMDVTNSYSLCSIQFFFEDPFNFA